MNKIERALSLYEQWLAVGDAGALEAMCAAHPDLAEHLRALAADNPSISEEIAADEAQSLGKTLGDYRLIAELGRGGMGVVYLARQVSLDREVAVKVLPHHLTLQAATVARFRREANLAARLVHPGIVAIYAVGKDGDVHYFAMERIQGRRLSRVDPRTGARRSVRECVEMAAAVADALAHAHAQGVLHRDVKPSNVLVREDGQPVLTDFGLAREIGALRITKSGAYAGTPAYSAPEQVAGDKNVDARADVWSLGATLYELLTEKLPFPGDSDHEVLHRIRSEDPVDPLRLVPDLAPDLTAIVLKALEKDRSKRYATAADFRDDLRAFLEHRPISARRATRLQRAGRWLQRHPAWRAALAVAGVGLLALPWLLSAAVADERDRAVAAERTARRQAYAANVLAAQNALANGDRGQAEQRLTACPDDLRGFEWHLVARSLDRSVWTARTKLGPVTAIAVGSDARYIAVGTLSGEVELFVPGDEAPRWQRRLADQQVTSIALDDAGTYVVATTAAGAVRTFDVATGQCMGEAGPLAGSQVAAIAPDASVVVRALGAGRFAVLRAPLLADEVVRELDLAVDRPHGPFASDGEALVGRAANSHPARWNLRSGDRERIVFDQASGASMFATDRDLDHALGGINTGDLTWWPTHGERVDLGHGGRRALLSVTVAPDGSRFAIGCQSGEILVYTTTRTMQLSRILNGHRAGVRSVAAGEGGWLASGSSDGEIKLWNTLLDAGAGEVTTTPPPLGGSGQPLAIVGAAMLSGGQSGIVRCTDRRSGFMKWETQLPHWINGMAVVGDGTLVACQYHEVIRFLATKDGAPVGDIVDLGGLGRARRMQASPDRTRIAVLDQGGWLGVLDVRLRRMTAERQIAKLTPYRLHGALAWTADGAQIVVGDDAGFVRTVAADTLATVGEFRLDGEVASVAVDGDVLYVAAWDRGAQKGALSRRDLATGIVRASQEITAIAAAIALLPGRLALARHDARLALHDRDDLTPMLELPQPGTHLWNVVAAPDGAWIALQAFGGEPRILVARDEPEALAEQRKWAHQALAIEAAHEAFHATSWTPRARAELLQRTDLPVAVREAAIGALPPTGSYFLSLHAEEALAAAPRHPGDLARLRLLAECLREAEPIEPPDGNVWYLRSLLALMEFRLGNVAAAEAALQRQGDDLDDDRESSAYAHYVRARLCLARGEAAAAAEAIARIRRVAAGQPLDSKVHDLLREVLALMAGR
jgi:WD40 repeat protein